MDGTHFPEGEGEAGGCGIRKHPFQQGDGRVSANQVLKENKVNGYAALGSQAENVPQQVVVSREGRRTPSAAGNQQNGSDGAGADPDDFFPVTISRRTNAARIMVNTGVMVVMMAASAGEVNPTPTVKAIWLKMIPNREA